MFGLMRAKKCGMSEEEKHFRRLNYCGTCKTTGAIYGQKARLLLNHDAVFLAEVLSALGGENVANWGKSYQSFNCLNLPKGEMPFALQFAATTNVILTEFKLADHIADENKRRYKLARRAFSNEFRTAEKILAEWNFPLDEVKAVLDSQTEREITAKSLDELAFPTAQTTAVFFCAGARLIGRGELENITFELGFAFGKLTYLLDAFEDYEKDFKNTKFNALRAAFDLQEEKLTPAAKRQTAAILHEIEGEIIEKINLLPLAENQKTLFIARLSDNLRRKLKTELPVLKASKICAIRPKQTFANRWRAASAKAQNLTRSYGWQMPLVFLFVFAFALVAPAATREARSARECFDLSFNLMALGAGLGAVLAFPKTLLMQKDPLAKDEEKRRWCDYCDCDCCCCCESCDGCGCDGCGCDGCCCDCSCD